MVLREEGLALGAKNGNETFGLDAFQGLLGRLNGKSEEILQREQEARRKVQMKIQQERRLGSLKFVSGGFLRMDEEIVQGQVGRKVDQLEGKVSTKKCRRSKDDQPDPGLDSAFNPKRSKKRKRPTMEEMAEGTVAAIDTVEDKALDVKPKLTRKKKNSEDGIESQGKKKSRSRDTLRVEQPSETQGDTYCKEGEANERPIAQESVVSIEAKVERRERKVAKKIERAERRARKEEKRMKKALAASERLNNILQMNIPPQSTQAQNKEQPPGLHPSVPHATNPPPRARGRHLIRQRYIQQKNMAAVDEKALNEIFMIKAQA